MVHDGEKPHRSVLAHRLKHTQGYDYEWIAYRLGISIESAHFIVDVHDKEEWHRFNIESLAILRRAYPELWCVQNYRPEFDVIVERMRVKEFQNFPLRRSKRNRHETKQIVRAALRRDKTRSR